jgi:hypothetical protein
MRWSKNLARVSFARIRSLMLISIILGTVAALLPLSALAGGLPAQQRGYLQQFAEVIALVIRADKEMWAQLQVVSRKLDQFYFVRGHFPETDDEKELFRKSLLRYIKVNPYLPQRMDIANNERIPDDGLVKIHFLQEAAMTPNMVRDWAHSAPPSWRADPGTIFVITNGYNYYCLWATSADSLPLRDLEHSSNKLRLIAHYCSQQPARPVSSRRRY